MENVNYSELWEKRGELSYIYNNEVFYTIGPIPHYYYRRKKLLNFMDRFFESYYNTTAAKMLDFGCGDGFYLEYLKNNFPRIQFYGCDLSEAMLARAKTRLDKDDVTLLRADGVIPFNHQFDLIIAISVLGFIVDDNRVESLLEDAHRHLLTGGALLTFDAVADVPRGTEKWKRRTEKWYEEAAQRVGFTLGEKYMIAYPLYERFHKYIGRHVKEYYENKEGSTGIEINQNKLYVKIIELVVSLSPLFPFNKIPVKEGNCVFVFYK